MIHPPRTPLSSPTDLPSLHASCGSMEPTLKAGAYAIYNRLAYTGKGVGRGDVVAFHSDELGLELAKRVIGIPGDEILFLGGKVIINGQPLDESGYIPEHIETYCNKSFQVPKDCVFVMGDNREYSYDSREYDQPYISVNCIDGKLMGQIDAL